MKSLLFATLLALSAATSVRLTFLPFAENCTFDDLVTLVVQITTGINCVQLEDFGPLKFLPDGILFDVLGAVDLKCQKDGVSLNYYHTNKQCEGASDMYLNYNNVGCQCSNEEIGGVEFSFCLEMECIGGDGLEGWELGLIVGGSITGVCLIGGVGFIFLKKKKLKQNYKSRSDSTTSCSTCKSSSSGTSSCSSSCSCVQSTTSSAYSSQASNSRHASSHHHSKKSHRSKSRSRSPKKSRSKSPKRHGESDVSLPDSASQM